MKMNNPHEKAVQAILFAYSCAMRLTRQLHNPSTDDPSASSYNLVESIIDCISDAISNLSYDKPKSEFCWFSDLFSEDSSPSHLQMSHSKKRKISSTSSSEIWREDSPVPIHYDGFIWRKYGQKYIKKSGHQRNYYRCSYSTDHYCEARKHEEKINDNPPVYRTTYFGQHTCQINHSQDANFRTVVNDLKSVQMIRFGKDLDQEKESHEQDKEIMDQRTDDIDQDCQDVLDDNPSSGSHLLPSSCGSSQNSTYDSEFLLDNLSWWDAYDQFVFGLH